MNVHSFVVDSNTIWANNTVCAFMFYWMMVQLLMVVPDTDVQRIRCRSSNAFGDRVVVLLWAIFVVVVYLKLNWKLVSKKYTDWRIENFDLI